MIPPPVIRIVDDDPHIHDALAFTLESEGFAVRHYFSAEEFLASDFLSDPGCLVLDVRMGRMSGPALQREMAARRITLPVIFLSAHGDIETAVGTMEAGAVTFLTKPVRTERLLEAVGRALERRPVEALPDAQTAKSACELLSERERQVALLACAELTNRRIAERLELSVRTVEFHRAGAMRKLGTHSAAEMRAMLAAAGLVETE